MRAVATFCLGMWVMGTLAVTLVASQNFYTIDRLLAEPAHPTFSQITVELTPARARDFLRHLSSELNRLYFRTWNGVQILLGGVTLWAVWGPAGSRRIQWTVVLMVVILMVLTFGLTPRLVTVGRSLDFVPRETPPPQLRGFGFLHAGYAGLEMIKMVAGLLAAYWTVKTK